MKSSDNSFRYHQKQLLALYQYCSVELPFSSKQANDVDKDFLNALKNLSDADQATEDYSFEGQSLLCRIVSQYSHITPAINRDLLWYFGGDCLHYLSDKEISQYQQLDELLFEAHKQGQTLDRATAKGRIFKLH
ncbi:MAG: dehydrogenase [Spongiibacteraceae bacterium]|nr:dehydrogenase [Spongiibacteraceae bacterium]